MLSGERTTQRLGGGGWTGRIRIVDDSRDCAEGVVWDRGQGRGASRITIGIVVKRETTVHGIKIFEPALIGAV